MDAIQTAYIVTKVVSSSFAHHEEVFSIVNAQIPLPYK